MAGDLGTTNAILGIIAAVSVLEALLLIGVFVGALMAYRRFTALINGIEARQIAPAMARLNVILDNLAHVSGTIKQEAERADYTVRSSIDSVDEAAGRIRSRVHVNAGRLVRLARGMRAVAAALVERAGSRAPSGTSTTGS